MITPNPNLEWYSGVSKDKGALSRCPFASAQRCPRFYESLSLLGSVGSTKIDAEEEKKLKEKWSRSDLWPTTGEQATSISGSARNPNAFSNFCPEVAYERFGIFSSFFIGYFDSVDRNSAHSRLAKEGARPEDWRWDWESLRPLHYTDCPLYSPLSHDVSRPARINAVEGHQVEGADMQSKGWWQALSAPQAAVLAAVIALAPAFVTGAYTYLNRPTKDEMGDQARTRIEAHLPKHAGFKSYVSPRIGLGFSFPIGWQVDDAIHVFGGGEIDLIRHYDTDANSISEGIKFALRVVQGNYVKYPQKEEDNYMDTIRKIDLSATIERAEINGQVGVKISYKQSTGKRIGHISRYWLRLHDRAKLEVVVFTNLGDDRKDFLNEVRDIISSIVLDKDVITANVKAIDR